MKKSTFSTLMSLYILFSIAYCAWNRSFMLLGWLLLIIIVAGAYIHENFVNK